MAHAMLWPEASKGGRGKKRVDPIKGFDGSFLSRARAVRFAKAVQPLNSFVSLAALR